MYMPESEGQGAVLSGRSLYTWYSRPFVGPKGENTEEDLG